MYKQRFGVVLRLMAPDYEIFYEKLVQAHTLVISSFCFTPSFQRFQGMLSTNYFMSKSMYFCQPFHPFFAPHGDFLILTSVFPSDLSKL